MRRDDRRLRVGMTAGLATILFTGLTLFAIGGVSEATPATYGIIPSPSVPGGSSVLQSVSCESRTSCVAVGWSQVGTLDQTLVESWNGTVWSIVSSPDQGSGNNALNSVSCSGSLCLAVGYSTGPSYRQTLVESSQSGAAWTIMASPNQSSFDNFLSGVSCASTAFCEAVGTYNVGAQGYGQNLVETWNGSGFSITPSPDYASNGSQYNQGLDGVSCTSSLFCQASGNWYGGPLIEGWNGSTWSIEFSEADSLNFSGVSCTSTVFCAVVGTTIDYSGLGVYQFPWVESWDGTSWTQDPTSGSGQAETVITGVSCTGPHACVLIGTAHPQIGGSTATGIETWNTYPPTDGNWAWTPTPTQGSNDNQFNGISCPDTSDCAMVGYYSNGSADQTLVENGITPAGAAVTGGTPQSTQVGTPYPVGLQATVVDAGDQPLQGVSVTFSAPASGPSGTFANGMTTDTEPTNASGVATSSTFTANNSGGSFSVAATASGVGGQLTYSLTNLAPPTFTSAAGVSFTQGAFGSFTPAAGGTPIPTITETGLLPDGVTFTGGVLSGTPTSAGTFPITFTADNGISPEGTLDFTLTVDDPPTITSASTATFPEQSPGSFTITTSGIPTPSISETGPLPPGVNFTDHHDGTATISGTSAASTVGSHLVTISASNGIGAAADQSFTLTISGLTVTTTSLPPAARGVPYSVQLQADGGVLPFKWKKEAALPKGLKLSSTGLLSGTPNTRLTTGSYPISLQVQDATKRVHQTATATLSLTVG